MISSKLFCKLLRPRRSLECPFYQLQITVTACWTCNSPGKRFSKHNELVTYCSIPPVHALLRIRESAFRSEISWSRRHFSTCLRDHVHVEEYIPHFSADSKYSWAFHASSLFFCCVACYLRPAANTTSSRIFLPLDLEVQSHTISHPLALKTAYNNNHSLPKERQKEKNPLSLSFSLMNLLLSPFRLRKEQ